MSDKPAVTVSETTVSCEGKGATSGHPRVYIKLDPNTHTAQCPYCGQAFMLDPKAKVSAAH